MIDPILFAIGCAIIALIYVAISIAQILKLKPGDEKMQEIAKAIQEGAKAFLNRQYTYVGVIAIIIFLLM